MSLCSDLTSFADGELDSARASAFRDHLRTCDACQAGLLEALQLSAQLSTIEPEHQEAKVGARPVDAAVHAVARAARSGAQAVGRRWKRVAQWGTGVLVTSGVAIAVMWPSRPPNAFAEQNSRPREIRFAYADASGHRPLRDPNLGTGNASNDTQRISFAALSALEKRRDNHGLAIARAWNGDKPADVINELSALQQTDAVRSDRAALEVVATTNDNIQPVLAELEALVQSPDAAAARAARWNYALVLSRLDLPLSAAAAFQDIATAHEPGWAEEASERAAEQTRSADEFSSTWKRADKAGKALEDGGPLVSDELVAARPGVLRAYFYSAVRSAATPERVLSLAPMAAALDQAGGPQQRTLSRYVEQVARADFSRRAPLARAFAALLAEKPVPEPMLKELTTETESADVADIVMGAMFLRDVAADHRAWFHRKAEAAGDGWSEVVLARAAATAELRSGNVEAADALLREGASRCGVDIAYQCLKLERERARLYADLDRVNEAQAILQTALRTARRTGEWGEYRSLLVRMTDVERFHAATAKVRAYADEVLRMGDVNAPDHDCRFRDTINRLLAGAAILDIDGRRARQHFTDSQLCAKPTLAQALLLTDIARLDRRDDDLVQLRNLLGTVRAGGKLTAGEQLLADETEGRLVIEREHSSGVTLLQNTIVAAERKIAAEREAAPNNMAQTVFATKARAAAYAALAFDAARAKDHARVLDLIAHDLGLSAPGNCTVGMVAEDERAAVVVRDATGADRGVYLTDRRPSAAPLTPGALASGLARCAHVTVMAPGALQGQPRVLPPELAWSYASGVPAHTTAVDPPSLPRRPGGGSTLIVTNVEPPAYLELEPLAISPPHGVPATTLSRLEATPSNVIAAMPDASEIQFHTHALMNLAISDAIYLVLTPEKSGGQYALTAEAIRKLELRAHPLVVLAACRSAKGATYQHQPWSLPDAFLTAGARAVFATATDIPDRQSGQFFAQLLARVRSGVEPAVALRDLRIEASPTQPWVADVILVE